MDSFNFDKEIKSCEIICVGTELLLGSTLNTNGNFISKELSKLGIFCYRETTIGDNRERLLFQINQAAAENDLVILSGGLGPTEDDLTCETAAAACGLSMVLNEESLERIVEFFKFRGREMAPNNKKQAMVPEGALVLQNDNGTAPGSVFMWEKNDHKCLVAVLPGPPSELIPMFNTKLKPIIEKYSVNKLINEYVHICGVGESSAEEMIKDLIDTQVNPTIAPYASLGECMFRVTQSVGKDETYIEKITPVVEELKNRFGDNIYEVGNRSLPEVLIDLLREKNLKLAFAESCTGGLLSSGIVDIPGSSDVFLGAVVSYDNSVKENVLKVSSDTLSTVGAVSSECAEQMAFGVRNLLNADIAVSVTGIAGPGGGSDEKPVGTVYIGFSSAKGTESFLYKTNGNRSKIRKTTAVKVYDFIRRKILSGEV